jgi:hypothetical protein
MEGSFEYVGAESRQEAVLQFGSWKCTHDNSNIYNMLRIDIKNNFDDQRVSRWVLGEQQAYMRV